MTNLPDSRHKTITSVAMMLCHHWYIIGKFCGAMHYTCTLKWCISKSATILIVFHNYREYEGHPLTSTFRQKEGEIFYIIDNIENCIMFSLRNLQFFNCGQFLLASLDKLVNSMATDGLSRLQ